MTNFEYYYSELNKVLPNGQNTISFKFMHQDGRKSNTLNLNEKSAKALLHWILKQYPEIKIKER